MNEPNVPPNRKSQNKRSAFPKRFRSEDSPKSARSSKSKKAPKPKKPNSAQAASSSPQAAFPPANHHPASVPGWQVVEFPSVLSEEAQSNSPRPSAPKEPKRPTPPQSSQDSTQAPQPSSVQPPAPEALISLIQDANQRNHALLGRITELEEALEQSRQALQAEVERTSDSEDKPGNREPDLGNNQQQVSYLLNQLEFAHQTTQRQEILIETLRHQLQTSQERVAQIEQDYQRLQGQVTDSTRELHQVRSQCRELQARLQRQQRYTLQFKAALEKCLEVPPPSYETSPGGQTIASFTTAPVTSSQIGQSDADAATDAASSFSPEAIATAATDSSASSTQTIPTDSDLNLDIDATTEASAEVSSDVSETDFDERLSHTDETHESTAKAPVSRRSAVAQSPLMQVPPLFPKSPQIQPWSATDPQEQQESENGQSDRPSLTSQPFVAESKADVPSFASADATSSQHDSGSDVPLSKFHATLRELAHVDLSQSTDVPQSSAQPDSESPQADYLDAAPMNDSASAPVDLSGVSQAVNSQSVEASSPQPPSSNVISMPNAFAARQETENNAVEAPSVDLGAPSQSASPRTIMPPDLRKEKRAQASDSAPEADSLSSPHQTGQQSESHPSHSVISSDFPGSFSIARPQPDEPSSSPSNSEVGNDSHASDPSSSPSNESSSASKSENLWRELANLVDASTDDILKTHRAEVFKLLKEELNQTPSETSSEADDRLHTQSSSQDTDSTSHSAQPTDRRGAANAASARAIANSRIPPLSIPQPRSPKTEATLAALAQQPYQPDDVQDPWLESPQAHTEATPGTASRVQSQSDRLSDETSVDSLEMTTPEKNSPEQLSSDTPIKAASPSSSTSDTEADPQSSFTSAETSQPKTPSEAPPNTDDSAQHIRREAQLPKLANHRDDDWMRHSAASEAAQDSSKLASATSTPNWPAPLLHSPREKPNKENSDKKAKAIDLPAFLR